MRRVVLLLSLTVLLAFAETASADPIAISFSGGIGGTTQWFLPNNSWSLTSAPLTVGSIGGVSGPFSGLLNITLPASTGTTIVAGVPGVTYSGGTISITASGTTIFSGQFSQGLLLFGTVVGGVPVTAFIGEIDPANSQYYDGLAAFNPLVAGIAGNVSLYFQLNPDPVSLEGAAIGSQVDTIATVAEPASMILLAAGMMWCGLLRKFQRAEIRRD